LILIAIPLALLLNVSLGRLESQRQQAALEKEVETVLIKAVPPEAGRVVEVRVGSGQDGYVVYATIYDYGNLGDDELTRFKELLSAELELPVRLEATVLDARRLDGE
jgi:hypothetical protein